MPDVRAGPEDCLSLRIIKPNRDIKQEAESLRQTLISNRKQVH